MRKLSTFETSLIGLVCALVFTVCGLILRGWFQEMTGLRERVAANEVQIHDVKRDVTDQEGRIDWLRQRRKDDLADKKEATELAERRGFRNDMLAERREWRADLTGIFDRLTSTLEVLARHGPPTPTPPTAKHGGS